MGGAWPRVPTEVVPRPLCPGSGKTIRGRHPACPHPRTNDKWSAQILLAHGWGHDVGFEARDGGQELVLLFLWHLELVESGDLGRCFRWDPWRRDSSGALDRPRCNLYRDPR